MGIFDHGGMKTQLYSFQIHLIFLILLLTYMLGIFVVKKSNGDSVRLSFSAIICIQIEK